MRTLSGHTVVVAGGTGNVGSFLVGGLLRRGATVVVPSRTEEKLDELRARLVQQIDDAALDRLHVLVGDIGKEKGAERLLRQITSEIGAPDAVVASLGQWRSVPLLSARTADLRSVLNDHLIAHFAVARAFLPGLKERGGTYVLVNGPLAFDLWPASEANRGSTSASHGLQPPPEVSASDTELVSIATGAQHMLFRALVQELEGTPARVVELINHAFIREKKTQPSSPIPGEAVGAYAAYLVSEAPRKVHGQSIPLHSLEQLGEVGLDTLDMR